MPSDDNKEVLAALEGLTEIWWKETGKIQESVAAIASMVPGPFKERGFDLIARLVKLAYMEGLLEGFESGRAGKAEHDAV